MHDEEYKEARKRVDAQNKKAAQKDPLLEGVRAYVQNTENVTSEGIQKRFGVGFMRSSRLMKEVLDQESEKKTNMPRVLEWFFERSKLSNIGVILIPLVALWGFYHIFNMPDERLAQENYNGYHAALEDIETGNYDSQELCKVWYDLGRDEAFEEVREKGIEAIDVKEIDSDFQI